MSENATDESTWQSRLRDEHGQVTTRLADLRAFIEGEQYPFLGEDDQDDLLEQLTHMEGYEAVLSRRIGRLEPEGEPIRA